MRCYRRGMARFAAVPPATRGLAGSAGTLLVAASVVLSPFLGPASSHFAGSGPLALTSVAAGVFILAIGLVLLATRPWWSSGCTAVIAAVLWFAPAWIAWDSGPPIVRSLGLIAVVFTPVVLGHLVLGFPGGMVTDRNSHLVLVVAYSVAAVQAAVVAGFYDPFRDVRCWANCSENVFLIVPAPAFAGATMIVGSVVTVAMLWFACASSLTAATADRRSGARVALVVAAAVLAGGATIAVLVDLFAEPEGPGAVWSTAGHITLASGVIVLVVAFAWQITIVTRRGRAVDEVVRSSIADRAVPIEHALRTALGDPGLTVAYWLPTSHRYVDAAGEAVAEPQRDASGRLATLRREGQPVAVIGYSAGAPELERELGPAFRVALENEGLRAEVEAQLAALRAARARIVAAGDAHRRDVERALHDGAQQQLTVLALRLRALADSASTTGEPVAASLDHGVELARAALDELRRVAHGIHPTVLEHEGLASALRTFATHAPLPLELDAIESQRAPASIEFTAYQFVVEAVEDAHRRHASHAAVRVVAAESTLTVAVEDDAEKARVISERILDRVGAVGGRVVSTDGGTRVELPCGS